jgi:two-component system NtrC family response regulator
VNPSEEDDVRRAVLGGKTLDECLAEEEKRLVVATIEACGGNKASAAGALGISREGLFKKIRRLGIR